MTIKALKAVPTRIELSRGAGGDWGTQSASEKTAIREDAVALLEKVV